MVWPSRCFPLTGHFLMSYFLSVSYNNLHTPPAKQPALFLNECRGLTFFKFNKMKWANDHFKWASSQTSRHKRKGVCVYNYATADNKSSKLIMKNVQQQHFLLFAYTSPKRVVTNYSAQVCNFLRYLQKTNVNLHTHKIMIKGFYNIYLIFFSVGKKIHF